MFKNIRITFIGPGSMAQAMIAGLVRNDVAPAGNILASGPRQERVDELRDRYGILPFTDNAEAATQADIVILSVKPQRLDKVMDGITGKLKPDALVLSIIAGAPIGKITVWTASEGVTEEKKELARQILLALGQEVYVEEEDYLDKATALSGTGPAYVYLFMEAMVDAGVHLGFSRRIAEQLVVETVRGAVNYYDLHDEHRHLARLRNQVTSPGGTSALPGDLGCLRAFLRPGQGQLIFGNPNPKKSVRIKLKADTAVSTPSRI